MVVAVIFLGHQLNLPVPQLTSLRALYTRPATLNEHQNLARRQLGFRDLTTYAERGLVAHLKIVRAGSIDPEELVSCAKQWLYEHQYLIPNERRLLDIARCVLMDSEQGLLRHIEKAVPASKRRQWFKVLLERWPDSRYQTRLGWLQDHPRAYRRRFM